MSYPGQYPPIQPPPYTGPHHGVAYGDPVPPSPTLPTGGGLVSKIQLNVRASGLPKLDTLSKSDPMCVVEIRSQGGQWRELGRTEVKKNDHEPVWLKNFRVDYHFEILQELKFSVYDSDSSSQRLESHDFIGAIHTTLGELVTRRGQSLTSQLVNYQHRSRKNGTLTVLAEEISSSGRQLQLSLRGEHLDKKDWFSKSDPYFIIHRAREDGVHIPVYKSRCIKNTLNPIWPPVTLSLTDLCNDDIDRPLIFECWDKDWASKDDLIGVAQFTVRQLVEGNQPGLPLINPKKTKRKGYENSGVIRAVRAELFKHPSFLDYIMGGCEVNLLVAIDFTASNGNPMASNSLHYRSPHTLNQYQKAIQAVGPIVMEYDTDKQVPAFGFGARLPPHNQVSHCFALNGQPDSPEVDGVEGLMNAYNQALNTVVLHGPTIFSNIIHYAANVAREARVTQDNQQYFILLIITDGEITDMSNTISAIIKASALPLSIIIVGVGDADFSRMDILDGDNALLQAAGETAQRDIVQFVPYRMFERQHISALAQETLAEIPQQVLSYMAANRIQPNSRR